ncbi:uncharacterized protein LOC118177491 isoform X1 [Oxyura jamaicensis]|uniref:uncharacterized protein LOC118177491 isoform X1 n=1 Tax=Oxyura jamaicensis TaxID=8884 RepID=UPI0015A69662|nr:uncharacterized protein LOC118177491 isoform X1 [Oxyura jamaicensis]
MRWVLRAGSAVLVLLQPSQNPIPGRKQQAPRGISDHTQNLALRGSLLALSEQTWGALDVFLEPQRNLAHIGKRGGSEGRLGKAELGAGWLRGKRLERSHLGPVERDGAQASPGGSAGPQRDLKTPGALWEQSRGSQRPWFCPQACRGDALDQGVFLETDGGQPEPCSFSDYLRIPPNTAVMFACSPGYGAFLNLSGSRFLQALLRALDGEERGLALGRLATRLNRDVALRFQARGTYKGCMQMPCFVTNLTREVFPFSATSESCQLLPGPALQRGPEEEERQSGCKKSPAT